MLFFPKGMLSESVLLVESVSANDVTDAIKGKYRVIINYNSHGENLATGWRIIEVYAYGLSKAGNPVIRAYQPQGDTASSQPSWKFFRLDRILTWKPTGQHFTEPRELYNPNGDKTMSVVYLQSDFTDGTPDTVSPNTTTPRPKNEPEIFRTPSEISRQEKLANLRRQLDNPIFRSDLRNDIKTQDGFQKSDNLTNSEPVQTTGPKTKQDVFIPQDREEQRQTFDMLRKNALNKQNNANIQGNETGPKPKAQTLTPDKQPDNISQTGRDDIFKTDTERNMERLRNQLNNPTYVDPSVLQDYQRRRNRPVRR